MKKHALLLILAIMLCVAFSFLAQWYSTKDYKNPYFGQPVFREDQQILAVEFDSNINGHGHEVIPDSSLDEIVNWLRRFTIGRCLGDSTILSPGAGSVQVTVTYADGSQQTAALDHIRMDDVFYVIDAPPAPDALPSLD